MDKFNELGIDVRTFFNARPTFMAGLLDTLKVPQFFDDAISPQRETGRNPDISDGIAAKLLLINICDQHHPLYRLKDYFLDKDISVLAGQTIDLSQLHDDRFGDLLDRMFIAGPKNIFNNIASHAFIHYGLSIRSLNYDTTSKIMWGEYQSDDGKIGVISITLGHSKDKRSDKNQLKIGLGTADGVILDAKVLSGNADDKTYNNGALDDANTVLSRHGVDKDSFYYVADSAFFTEPNIKKAENHGINFITRAPETVNLTKDLVENAWTNKQDFLDVKINGQTKVSSYRIQEFTDSYREIPCKFAVCYSISLEKEKQKTLDRRSEKEQAELSKLSAVYVKREFACEADAQKEIEELGKKKLTKIEYHTVDLQIIQKEKRAPGRPRKDQSEEQKSYVYHLVLSFALDEEAKEAKLKRQSTFVLATNDLDLSAEEILVEYKTQSSVEKKFQQLKSPHFVNSLYLKKPERVESLVYMILIAMMVLSVIERVVRREMQKEDAIVIGPGGIKMKRPTLRSIIGIFGYAPVNRYIFEGNVSRQLLEPFSDSQLKIMRYLGISTTIFTNST